MKRDNTNPIYLIENTEGDGPGFLTKLAGAYVLGGAGATAIKYARMKYNATKILKRFPTPNDLREALSRIDSPLAKNILSRLDPQMSSEDYYNFIQKYICGNKTGKWLATMLLPGTLAYQTAQGITDTGDTPYDKLISAVD